MNDPLAASLEQEYSSCPDRASLCGGYSSPWAHECRDGWHTNHVMPLGYLTVPQPLLNERVPSLVNSHRFTSES